MRKMYPLLATLLVAAASLTSCSRSNYAFNNNAPAYLGAERARTASVAVVAAATPEMALAEEATLPAAKAVTKRRAAHSQRHTAAARVATATPAAQAVVEPVSLLKLDRKAVRKELKKQLAAAPMQAADTGKSQTTALILCILLGGIGVHQFYLGYTGRGILRIALALTSFLIVPAIVNLVLYILDIIKIVNGELKPRDGEYGQKFNK